MYFINFFRESVHICPKPPNYRVTIICLKLLEQICFITGFLVVYYATSLVGALGNTPKQTYFYFCNGNHEHALSEINKDSKKVHVSSGQVLPPNEFAANFLKTLFSGHCGIWNCI